MPWFDYPPLFFRGNYYLPPSSNKKSGFDVILITGDAYVDHPAFPAASLLRHLERLGLSVAVIAQPDWRSNADFLAWGAPELFFAVAPGAMDSMVAKYTATKMPRSVDRLSADGDPSLRPKRASLVYVQKIRENYKNSLIILGGVEASMRRFAHYDFWENRVKNPILTDSDADLLLYGMVESVLERIVNRVKSDNSVSNLFGLPQTSIRVPHTAWKSLICDNYLLLPSVKSCISDKSVFMQMSKIIDQVSNKILIQEDPKGDIICFPPNKTDQMAEVLLMDKANYNRRSHPIYQVSIPALEPVQFSIQSHRGCLGKCSFCALSLHQGRIMRSRSEESILEEAKMLCEHPDFKGIIPDVGGPAANMYAWSCKNFDCIADTCVEEKFCPNLYNSLKPYKNLLTKIASLPKVRKVFIGSGLRYDLIREDEWDIFEKIVLNHVSGQLKVAPEHFDKQILKLMRKGEKGDFGLFVKKFNELCKKNNKKLYLIPYLITAFPGSEKEDKILIKKIKELNLAHQQIQEFTPTPGSLATAMYYTEMDTDYHSIKVQKNRLDRLKSRKAIQRN